MKKRINAIAMSCLVCFGMLANSALPVQAIGPDSCSHPYFALGIDENTGEYEYLESGHYQVWGTPNACLRCGYEYYSDTHLKWDSDHELGGPTLVLLPNGTTEVRYYCEFNGCDWYGVYE